MNGSKYVYAAITSPNSKHLSTIIVFVGVGLANLSLLLLSPAATIYCVPFELEEIRLATDYYYKSTPAF